MKLEVGETYIWECNDPDAVEPGRTVTMCGPGRMTIRATKIRDITWPTEEWRIEEIDEGE